ncbi:uncharacterized protein LOC135160796 [Diachasmimorpha longicaudata]|uniref:uncharacterized protein LOC135160796 n=1 Tax=Diachasmimorpha longicaudata TaxID=58733 RepID=UPI0030B8EAC8
MTSLRISLVISCISVVLCLSARSHRFPRSDCGACLLAESQGAQRRTPKNPAEQFSTSLTGQSVRYPFFHPTQYSKRHSDSFTPSSQSHYVSLRAKRSLNSEKGNEKNVMVVPIESLANAAKIPQSQSESKTHLSDKRLEEIVTRAILSARNQVQAQSTVYWHGSPQHSFHDMSLGNEDLTNAEYIYEDLEEAYPMPPNMTITQPGQKETFTPVGSVVPARDSFVSYGTVGKIIKENQGMADSGKFNAAKGVGNGGVTYERMGTQGPQHTLQAPPYEAYVGEAAETAIPAP